MALSWCPFSREGSQTLVCLTPQLGLLTPGLYCSSVGGRLLSVWGRQERDNDQRKNCKQVTSPGGEKIGVGSLRPRVSTSSSHWGKKQGWDCEAGAEPAPDPGCTGHLSPHQPGPCDMSVGFSRSLPEPLALGLRAP